jgi:hypothetical protein
MSYLQYQSVFKYLLITCVLFAILYFLPTNKLDIETILKITLIIIILLFIFENFVFGKSNMEGMTSECSNRYALPMKYTHGTTREDKIRPRLGYDDDVPGYYLINNGNFCEGGINYDKVRQLINDSMYHHLYQQHNFNILWSPHTHIGKNRGYMNWDKMYD